MAAREGLHCMSARLSEVLRRLGENGGSGFSLGEHALVLSDPAEFLSCFFIFPFTLLLFFPPSIIIYLKITQNRD